MKKLIYTEKYRHMIALIIGYEEWTGRTLKDLGMYIIGIKAEADRIIDEVDELYSPDKVDEILLRCDLVLWTKTAEATLSSDMEKKRIAEYSSYQFLDLSDTEEEKEERLSQWIRAAVQL